MVRGSSEARRRSTSPAAGLTPVIFDNLSSGHRWALRWGAFEEADLADRAAIDRVLDQHAISAVIHLASFIQVGESVRAPQKYFRNNVASTMNLLDAMVARGVRDIVFSSSAAVYGMPVRVPLDEEHPIEPLSPYGDSKMFVERILRWYGDAYGLRWAALRYFNAAGADPDGQLGEEHESESHLIPLALAAALGRPRALRLRHRLPDARRHGDPRLHPRRGPRRRARAARVRHLAAGGASFAANVGTGVGSLGAGGHQLRRARHGPPRRAPRGGAAGRRLTRARRRREEDPRPARMEASLRRARGHGGACPSLVVIPAVISPLGCSATIRSATIADGRRDPCWRFRREGFGATALKARPPRRPARPATRRTRPSV